MDLLCSEIPNFIFSNIIPRGVLTCKILTLQGQYFQKYKAQKIVKFNCRLQIFLKFCPQKLWHFEDVPVKCQNNFYIILSSYVEGHVQKNSSQISCLWLVSRPPKSGCFLVIYFVELFWKSFSCRNSSLEPPVYWLSNSFPYDMEESRELRDFIR